MVKMVSKILFFVLLINVWRPNTATYIGVGSIFRGQNQPSGINQRVIGSHRHSTSGNLFDKCFKLVEGTIGKDKFSSSFPRSIPKCVHFFILS